MGQLSKRTGNTYTEWSTGYAEFGPQYYPLFGQVMVSVTCQIEDFKRFDTAFLDTGAELPLIGGETARKLENRPIEKENVTIATRFGKITGNVLRMTITLIADQGENLPIESSVLVAEEWEGPEVILGYDGFLNRLRFAFDPGLFPPGKQLFYFGNEADPVSP